MSKRANGEGTIYKRKDGRYEATAFLSTTGGNRRRVSVYGPTRAEAASKLTERLDQERRHIPQPERRWTVAGYLDYWLREVVPIKNRPRTVELYEATIRLHIVPLLGKRSLLDLSVSDVQSAVNWLLRNGMSPRSVHKFRTVLSSALGRAVREQHIHRNVARLVELPAWERKTITPWSADEASRFLSAVRGHRWELGFLLAILYGMRRGEVLGLRWCDIDFTHGIFRIERQVQRIGGALVSGPVKTSAGRRTLPIVASAHAVLLRQAALAGVDLTATKLPDTTVLTSTTGRPVEPRNFVRSFQEFCATAGVRVIAIHHLRHTAATHLKAQGVAPRDAQLILGHAHVTTTQQLYQHGDVAAQASALTAMDLALSGPTMHDEAADGSGCRQTLPSNVYLDGLSTGEGTEIGALTSGGSGGDRTLDILLKSTVGPLLQSASTSVREALHSASQRRILGRVAVNGCRQNPEADATFAHLLQLHRIITTSNESTGAFHERPA
jgi:integrase